MGILNKDNLLANSTKLLKNILYATQVLLILT